jgi:hypothetical protein
MPDCQIDTYREGSGGLVHRAIVVHTATGRTLYTTWPYGSEASAIGRARRWLAEEYQRVEHLDLFDETPGQLPG